MKRMLATLATALALYAMPARAQNSVKITWSPSSSAAGNPSLTYNVYRASSCPGQFSKVNSTAVTGTTYIDATVAAGAAYCYQVTAVLGGIESTPSNQAVVAVPPPSNRPETCGHHGAIIGWIRCVASRPKKGSSSTQTP
jgi:fibronectin type 3 domain-containing protein